MTTQETIADLLESHGLGFLLDEQDDYNNVYSLIHEIDVENDAEIERLKNEVDRLTKEVKHWKSNHDNRVNMARFLVERTDLPVERVSAYKMLEAATQMAAALKAALRLIDDLMPGVRHIALQDYFALNDTPIKSRAALKAWEELQK